MKRFLLIVCLLICIKSDAQILTEASAKFNDSFVEWDILTDDENTEGTLTMTWQRPDDWTQWSYRVGEKTGAIKTKWLKDPSLWELRGENKIISMQQVWSNDPRLWRITDNAVSLDLKSRYGMNFQEWMVDEGKRGKISIFMDYPNDPRDWVIEDDLDESITFPMKMAILFLVIYNSVPKT
jgi:hypothetical protein